MKRYVGISAYRYGGWRDAPNKLTPEEVQAAMHAPAKGAPPMYDPQCLALAEAFLEQPGRMRGPVDDARARRLAQAIQDTIEAFIQDEADDAREAGRR